MSTNEEQRGGRTNDGWDGVAETHGGWGGLSLVVDTDTYAGNLERELCAASTGQHDETSTAAEELAAAYDGPDLSELIGGRPDRHGCYRRCTIYPTPGAGGEYRSARIYLNEEPTPEVLDGIKRRALALAERGHGEWLRPFKVLGFRLIREHTVTQSRAL